MFTGIIEEVGTVRAIKPGRASCEIVISAREILSDLKLGDSVAVNGTCLTVTAKDSLGFSADAVHETVNRTTLGSLSPGGRVNLERAMPANGRFGGHIVAGHVDGTGTVTEIRRDDNAVWYTVRADAGILRCVVEKGSIAIDGISLTVARAGKDSFSVSVIPFTRSCTTLADRRVGDRVNLETDIIGKYVEKLLSPEKETGTGGLTREFLAENGF